MKILLVGSGGREHALGWKLVQSRIVSELISAPGNPGLAELGRCVAIKADDAAELAGLAAREQVGLVVVGPRKRTRRGPCRSPRAIGIPCFGPSQAAPNS
ncbi:MAG: phosphoribosylamine--glycine ligase N-terminal domain-containing protein [Terricaulis sp.]